MIVKFFITPVYPFGNDHYFHEMIAVAEGFEKLGYKVIGNTDYWYLPNEKRFLIPEALEGDFDIAIYDYRYVTSFNHLLFRSGYPNFDKTKKHILIDRNDFISPIWDGDNHYKIFDVIFSGNLFTKKKYPENVKPWAIGLTNRIIDAIDSSRGEIKHKDITYNYRVPHNLRKIVLEGMEDKGESYKLSLRLTKPFDTNNLDLTNIDHYYWKYSVKRHNPEYYKLINESLLLMSVGGYYDYRPLVYKPYNSVEKVQRKFYAWYNRYLKIRDKDFSPAQFIYQYDSFRLWESFYANCCPIFMDCDFWSFKLPVQPVEGETYIGINGFDFEKFNEKLKNLSEAEVEKIGRAGVEWVKKYYSPEAQAKRILDHL